MNEIQIFNNSEFGAVRTLETTNGKVLFCGADVAAALGYSNARDALSRHCKEKGVVKCDTLTKGGMQLLAYIDEGNLYRLITHSKLPSAERFESWVFDEVLPAIRKTGSYNTPDYSALSPQLQFMIQMEQRQNTLEQRVTLLEQNQNQIQRLSILTATDTLTARFIKECCTRRICSDNITSAKLYIAFEMWCCQQGAMYIPKKSEFVNQMLDFFHTSDRRCIKRKSHGQLYYVITLTPQAKEKLGFVL